MWAFSGPSSKRKIYNLILQNLSAKRQFRLNYCIPVPAKNMKRNLLNGRSFTLKRHWFFYWRMKEDINFFRFPNLGVKKSFKINYLNSRLLRVWIAGCHRLKVILGASIYIWFIFTELKSIAIRRWVKEIADCREQIFYATEQSMYKYIFLFFFSIFVNKDVQTAEISSGGLYR